MKSRKFDYVGFMKNVVIPDVVLIIILVSIFKGYVPMVAMWLTTISPFNEYVTLTLVVFLCGCIGPGVFGILLQKRGTAKKKIREFIQCAYYSLAGGVVMSALIWVLSLEPVRVFFS